jgi:hypothetical protein
VIKEQLRTFLHETLHLELSQEKTLVTHATTQKARFVGYDITVARANAKLFKRRATAHSRGSLARDVNGCIALRVPANFIEERCKPYLSKGKVIPRPEKLNDSDYSIVSSFQTKLRGYYQYYRLAENVCWLRRVQWIMGTSLLKTLANKHKSTVSKEAARLKTKVQTPHGLRTCLQTIVPREGKKPLVAQFGGIPLRRVRDAVIQDVNPRPVLNKRTDLEKRLLADECELCGSTENVEVHHIHRLADIDKPGRRKKPDWMRQMMAKRRKTLVVCRECHHNIHMGRPTRQPLME